MNVNDAILDPAFWHNCPVPEPSPSGGGHVLPRFPAEVRRHLDPAARPRALDSCGVELRFVTEAPLVRVTLGAHAEGGEVLVWLGDLHVQRVALPAGTPVTLRLERPAHLATLAPTTPLRRRFSPDLWRLEFGRGAAVLHGLETFDIPIRPPRPDEVPARRWLAHGSSITHANASGYAAQAARRLGVDVLNKGLAGSCHADLAAARHFAAHERWDFATLELGVNMRGCFTPEAFRERATAFLDHLRQARPEAPLGIITHFTNAQHFPADPQATSVLRQQAFDETLRTWVAAQRDGRIRLFEGCRILDDFTLLSADLIHPTLEGQTRMGENLAAALTEAGFLA